MTFMGENSASAGDDDASYHHDEWNDNSWVEQTYEELMAFAAEKERDEELMDGTMPGGYTEEQLASIQKSMETLNSDLNKEKERLSREYKTANALIRKNPGKALRMIHGLERDIENLMMRLTNETDPLSTVSDDDQIDLLFGELMKTKQLKEELQEKSVAKMHKAAPKKTKKTSKKKSDTKKKKK